MTKHFTVCTHLPNSIFRGLHKNQKSVPTLDCIDSFLCAQILRMCRVGLVLNACALLIRLCCFFFPLPSVASPLHPLPGSSLPSSFFCVSQARDACSKRCVCAVCVSATRLCVFLCVNVREKEKAKEREREREKHSPSP